MEVRSLITKIFLIAFISATAFGSYITILSPMEYDTGCPFAAGHTAVCATPLEHLGHWQSAFVAIVAEFLVLIGFVAIFFSRTGIVPNILGPTEWRLLAATPFRPTILQELFSSGVLNRKEPYHS